jgi:osmoprotectant transport system permease protein
MKPLLRATMLGVLAFVLCVVVAPRARANGTRVVTGSKAFPESWILGEALRAMAAESGAEATHAKNLGGTEIALAALRSGAIDIYAEYTGTIDQVVLHDAARGDDQARRQGLLALGIGMSERLGFDDSYALATSSDVARRTGIRSIGDLRQHGDLRLGLTHEFMGRADGLPGLTAHYGLTLPNVKGVQHELGYDALTAGSIDILDVYTTDAQIERMGLVVLDDDRHFFPRYDAVLLYRQDLPTRAPQAFAAMARLVGTVDTRAMTHANAAVALDHRSVEDAAAMLLPAGTCAGPPPPSMASQIARDTLRHVQLVLLSLCAAILVGIPIGIVASRSRAIGSVLMTITSLVQTVPSLALLALLVPLLGIGAKPAIVALLLYGLLPIARNTFTGLTTISPDLVRSADALGLSSWAKLRLVTLPLASPVILAGVKTSAVINVGTATIAALVGADGLGNPILQGIALRDTGLLLRGALPAAGLSLLFELGFAALSRVVIPHGLRGGTRP